MNSFLIEYKVEIDLATGLKGVVSSHELPKGAVVQIGDATMKVKATQPVIFRYFPATKKLHCYYDGFRIWHGHTCCNDRIHLKAIVFSIINSFGISGFEHLKSSFKKFEVEEFIEFMNSNKRTFNCYRYNLWLNHFDEELELSKYKK